MILRTGNVRTEKMRARKREARERSHLVKSRLTARGLFFLPRGLTDVTTTSFLGARRSEIEGKARVRGEGVVIVDRVTLGIPYNLT